MGLFRKRARLRALDERECYLRLHGGRSGEIEIVDVRQPASPEPSASPVPAAAPPAGPTDAGPALHLLISFPRNAGRLTGEQVRDDLLRRMRARAHEAA